MGIRQKSAYALTMLIIELHGKSKQLIVALQLIKTGVISHCDKVSVDIHSTIKL
jgi:hypothetical protein